jgi:polyisoprenoid-binding protein YceI
MKSISISIAWVLALSASWAQAPSAAVYSIDPAHSRIELTVFRSGLLKMIGHDHAIAAKSFSGQVRLNPGNMRDSSVQLDIDARSLVVLDDPSVSERDRQQIQANMEGAKVLNVQEFPQIVFHSTGVNGDATAPNRLLLRGRLNLHGVEKEMAFPVQVHREANRLRVTGTAVVTQTDFGIKPIKVAAGGLRAKDRISVKFEILAEKVD